MRSKKIILLIGVIFVIAVFTLVISRTKDVRITYKCDNKKVIRAVFHQGASSASRAGEFPVPAGSVNLSLSDGRELFLPQTISASGIRYANPDESIVFWGKGDSAFMIENNTETYQNCTVSGSVKYGEKDGT